MSKAISLQELIEKLKADLFSPYIGTANEGKIAYPIFLLDEINLELAVNIEYDNEAGIKITVPQIVEGSISGIKKSGNAHVIKLKLLPILTRQEIRELMDKDERLMRSIGEASILAFRRGVNLAGE